MKWISHPDQRVVINPHTGLVDHRQGEKVINPLDLTALEAGLTFAEQWGGQVVAATVSTDQTAEQGLRIALAMGAHRALLAERGESPLATSSAPGDPGEVLGTMITLCREVRPSLILMGRQSADQGRRMLGGMLARALEMPHGANVIRLKGVLRSPQEPNNHSGGPDHPGLCIQALWEVDDSIVTTQLPLPCLLTVNNRLCVPRRPSLAAFARAGRGRLDRVPMGRGDQGGGLEPARQWGGPRLAAQSLTPPRTGKVRVLTLEAFARELTAATEGGAQETGGEG